VEIKGNNLHWNILIILWFMLARLAAVKQSLLSSIVGTTSRYSTSGPRMMADDTGKGENYISPSP
jgi:hypothetical protein